MKTINLWLLALLLVLVGAGTAFASSCGTNTYDNYVGPPPITCTILVPAPGNTRTLSNFSYSSAGTDLMPANQITVSSVASPASAGLLFNAPWTTSAGKTQQSLIGFTTTLSSGSSLFNGLTLLMFGAGYFGTGSVSVSESYCLGDTFSDGCAHGTTGTLSTFLNGKGSKLIDTVSFAGVHVVDVEKDIQLTGGDRGFAVLSGVENQILETPVPEPGSLATLASGLIAMAGLLGRRLFA